QGGARQQARGALSPLQTGSFGSDGERKLYRLRFPMVELLGQNPERKCFRFRHRFFLGGAIGENAWKLRNFGYPASVDFAICFNGKFHPFTEARKWLRLS